MITEYCMTFGLLPNDVLYMPAIQFYTTLRISREIKEKQNVKNLIDLVNIQAINIANFEYYEKLRDGLIARIDKPDIKLERDNALDPVMAQNFLRSALRVR